MPLESAFAILGPDTVVYGHCGEAIQKMEKFGRVVNAEMRTLSSTELRSLALCGPRQGRTQAGPLKHFGGQPVLCLVVEGTGNAIEQVHQTLTHLQAELHERYSGPFRQSDLYAPVFPERAKHAIDVVFHGEMFDVPETVPRLPDPKDIPPTNLGKLLRPSQFAAADDTTLAILKPDTVIQQHCGEILRIAENVGHITALRMVRMTREQLQRHLDCVSDLDDFKPRIRPFMKLPMIPFVLKGPHIIGVWRAVIGPTDSTVAREKAPETLRALYGTDPTFNAVHGSGDAEEAAAETNNFFTPKQIFEKPDRPTHTMRRLPPLQNI